MLKSRFTALDVLSSAEALLLAKQYGSPLYVYRQSIIKEKVKRLLDAAHDFTVSYAVKANTNKFIIKLIRDSGITHLDAVSPGEIIKALQCGYQPPNILYTQNFISSSEMDFALQKGVTLNIGALQTLTYFKDRLKGKSIFIRVNPKLGAGQTHYVITGGPKSKFGIYEDDIDELIKVAKQNDIHIVGLHQHIGSNIKKKDESIIFKTMRYAFDLLPKFDEVKTINIGGGFGVAYSDTEEVTDPYVICDKARKMKDQYSEKLKREIHLSLEPGRYIVADSAVLLCTITASKKTSQKLFHGTDTGFNHLIRPALYGAHHEIVNLTHPQSVKQISDICGNICQCTDFLAIDTSLGGKIGDLLAIQNVGAYGFSMSSNYNERPKPAEVMIRDNGEFTLIRRRQTFEDLADKL